MTIGFVLKEKGEAMAEKWISTGIVAKKELESADKCQLPNLIKGICKDCRDVRYCYRQRTLFDERRAAE